MACQTTKGVFRPVDSVTFRTGIHALSGPLSRPNGLESGPDLQETCRSHFERGSGSPEGIRTLVADLRSQSPRPLDDGAALFIYTSFLHFYTELLLTRAFRTGVDLFCAGVPGLEPRLAEPESEGLPITPYPKAFDGQEIRITYKSRGQITSD